MTEAIPSCEVCEKPMVFVRRFKSKQGEGTDWKCPTCANTKVTDIVITDTPNG